MNNEVGTFTDQRDGKIYKTVKIGRQIWMAENLNVSIFRNGFLLPEVRSSEEWIKTGSKYKPAWCHYNNDPENGRFYGKLYNWYAVNDHRNLAPEGWHVPEEAEWKELTDYLGGKGVAGGKMKSSTGWENNGNGTNESGFSALPGGTRYINGAFYGIGNYGSWWSSIPNSSDSAWNRLLDYADSSYGRGKGDKANGFSVRCIRDSK
jgi:uncharacterized protein (TIGR02145 family)